MGVVMDLSPGGFFVQTGARPEIGSRVDVALRGRDGSTVDVQATVTNRRRVPSRLMSVARGGVGCKIDAPPEDYFRLLGELSGT